MPLRRRELVLLVQNRLRVAGELPGHLVADDHEGQPGDDVDQAGEAQLDRVDNVGGGGRLVVEDPEDDDEEKPDGEDDGGRQEIDLKKFLLLLFPGHVFL